MARFTQDAQEMQHIQQVHISATGFMIRERGMLRLIMRDGSEVTGILAGTHTDNNSGEGGFWAVCGTVKLIIDGTQHEFDALEVDYVVPAKRSV